MSTEGTKTGFLLRGRLDTAEVAAAAVLAQAFTIYLVALRLLAPPTVENWRRADPILKILGPGATLALVPAVAVLLGLFWWWRGRMALVGAVWRRAALHGALGLVFCAAVAFGLRLAVGPTLPSFIPAEESAGPGFLLSMTAGYAEELIFRLALVPLLFFGLAGRAPRWVVVAVPVVASGLGFALLHEAGPGASSVGYFVTRVIVPGCGMTLAFLYVSPSFLVMAHCGAHLFIPWLFTGP